jgi:rod shape-determining protein MreD
MKQGSAAVAATISLVLALMLAIVPMPPHTAGMRPDWVLLVLMFWCLARPDSFGLLWAFGLGLLLDTLTGALVGQHALALMLVTCLVLKFRLRLRVFPPLQLMIAVLGLLILYQFTLFWIDGVASRSVPLHERWWPVISGTLAWPLVHWLGKRGLQQDDQQQAARL